MLETPREKVFCFSFRPENDHLVRDIDRVVRSHGLVLVTGEILGGQGLTQQIQTRIKESDAVIALFTREQKLEGKEEWLPTQWVRDEYSSARGRSQIAIEMIEQGVQLNGAYSENEHIKLDRAAQSEAFIRLSETIGLWRAESGRSLEIRLLPDAAATLAANEENAKCQYRLCRRSEADRLEGGKSAIKPGSVFLVVRHWCEITVKIWRRQPP